MSLSAKGSHIEKKISKIWRVRASKLVLGAYDFEIVVFFFSSARAKAITDDDDLARVYYVGSLVWFARLSDASCRCIPAREVSLMLRR